MYDFIRGSSIVAALPTLMYIGFHQNANRIGALALASTPGVREFLSIPYEAIVLGILVAYGLTYKIMRLLHRAEDGVDESVSGVPTKTLIVGGAILGLTLSIIGRFVLNLPVKMFHMSPSRAHLVHPIAIVLYALIFLYVDKALGIDF